MNIAKNLQYLRKRDKITQEELADRIGVSRQSVSKWETGEAYPETDKLVVICDLFNISLDSLMRSDLSENKTTDSKSNVDSGEYIAHMNKFARGISLGVWLILFGVAVCLALGGFATTLTENSRQLTEIMSGVAVILFIIPAVFLFIFNGINHDKFLKEYPAADFEPDKELSASFAKKFTVAMACLVSAILADVVFLVILTSFIDAQFIVTANEDAAYCYVVAAFMCILAFIVGGLVYLGIRHSALNGNAKQLKQPKHKKFSDTICGVVMMSATAIFLVLGFVWNLWHPGWVVFPVGGIICGIISAIFSSVTPEE